MISNVYCSVSCTDNSVFLKEKTELKLFFLAFLIALRDIPF